jgi:sodium/bile acid cotransporter 7
MTVSSVIEVHNGRAASDNRSVRRVKIDPFILGILTMVGLALLLPATGVGAVISGDAATVAIGLLFFLYGARLAPAEALAAVRHWRLHLTVFAATFVLFPLLGIAARALVPTILPTALYPGVLLLCCLPSTVQSSIAFTSIARGNVAAAIASASFSSVAGIVVTPVLVTWLDGSASGGFSASSALDIVLQLLAPFLAGQLARRWLADWIAAHRRTLSYVDRGSILLVVYTAFSEGVVAGIWHRLSVLGFVALIGVDVVLLALALGATTLAATRFGFDRADRITIIFCGSKKSLAAGLPMAGVLFAGHDVGLVVLPLMLFHQIQLMVCAALARRWAARAPIPPAAEPSGAEPVAIPAGTAEPTTEADPSGADPAAVSAEPAAVPSGPVEPDAVAAKATPFPTEPA